MTAKDSSSSATIGFEAKLWLAADNPRLKGVLPKDYARAGLDKHRLGELIDLIGNIILIATSEGERSHRLIDLLGRGYEYFLTRFASADRKGERDLADGNRASRGCMVYRRVLKGAASLPWVLENCRKRPQALRIMNEAHQTCPYSRALRGDATVKPVVDCALRQVRIAL